jgi:hypothetical protein
MCVRWKVLVASSVAAVSLVGCQPTTPGSQIGYEHFRFTCCVNSDLQKAWHPGEEMALHWIAASAGMTSDATGVPIELSAVLSGPYASVATLKAGGSHARALAASPIAVTDRTPGDPVSGIVLPLDLPAGWYNLTFTIRSAGGNLVESATVVQVTLVSP